MQIADKGGATIAIRDKHEQWPTTVEEAVERVLRDLSDKEKETVRAMAEKDLIDLHFGLGMAIRNTFGLWGGNEALLMSCAEASGRRYMHPDDASGVIIEAVWRRVQRGG